MAAMVGGAVSRATGGKFANGAVTAAMAYAFNQAQQGAESRRAGKGLLLGEGESVDVLTPRLMRRRMSLLRGELEGLITDLSSMSVDEFAEYLGKGPPGDFHDVYEMGQESLVGYLDRIHTGLGIRSFNARLEAIGSAAIDWGISRGAGKALKAIGTSDMLSKLAPISPEAMSRQAWSRQPNVSCTDVRVCSFDWN